MSKAHMNYLRRKTADEAELWAADRIEELERELECERIRLTACGVVALANTPDSAAKAREMSPEYRSASLDDVTRAVDSEMALRRERDALQADNARLREALYLLGNNLGEFAGAMETQGKAGALIWYASDCFDALAPTPEQSLARLRNEVLEEAAKVCDEYADNPVYCGNAIRELKEPQ